MTLAELIDLHEGQMLEITIHQATEGWPHPHVIGAAVTYDWDEVAVYDRDIDTTRHPTEWLAIEQAWIDAGQPAPGEGYTAITLDRNGTLIT